MKNGAVLIFARRPERGKVKTRLDARLGGHLTLLLYRAFLADTLISAHQSGAKVILAHTPGPNFPEQALADITFPQRGTSFGERFDSSLWDSANSVPAGTPLVLVGADTPQLSPIFLRMALAKLHGYDAVIGPNDNGGFYLLGFSRQPIRVAHVFDYSAEEEPRELDRLLRRAGLRTAFLEPHFDVDFPEDLVRLTQVISELERTGAAWIPKNTWDLLRSESLISLAVRP